MERLDDSALTPRDPGSASAEPTVSELKADIAEAQGDLQETLAEIQQRLSPAHLAEQAKATVHDATVGRVTNMAEHVGDKAAEMMSEARRKAAEMTEPVRENPWPLALIGVGIAWYIANARSRANAGRRRRYDDWDDEFESDASTSDYSEYSEYPSQSRSRWMSDRNRPSAQRSAADVGRRVRATGRSTQARLGHAIHDNPIVAGVVAVAAGALIGTVMPRTELEDRYLGEARDTVIDSARAMAEENVQRLSKAVTGEETTDATTGAPPAVTS
jgi:ElaB/YqjD/DUF883 family membrane-anchored ribosome-binding protein